MDRSHQDQPVATAGPPLEQASAAQIWVHGRGARAQGMVDLARQVGSQRIAVLAPQAAGQEWYPNSFLAPVETNEPWRSSGLEALDDLVDRAVDAGIAREHILVGGFSQGACLASEYAARTPARYGAVVALSGGLIGESVDPDSFDGSLDGTPVFLGCGDRDPHVPVERVERTAEVFRSLAGAVDLRLYEGMAHGVIEDELAAVRELVQRLDDDTQGA